MAQKESIIQLTSQSISPLRYIFRKDDCTFLIYDNAYHIPLELSIFLSFPAYEHFLESNDPFRINIDRGFDIFSRKDVISSFESLLSLVCGSNSIKTEQSRIPILIAIAKGLGNEGLENDLSKFVLLPFENLTLKSTMLSSYAGLKSSDEFSFVVCGRKFRCPKVLAALFSHKVLRLLLSDNQSSELILNAPQFCRQNAFIAAFQMAFSLLSGSALRINHQNFGLISSVAHQIESPEIINLISYQKWDQPLDVSNCEGRIKSLSIYDDPEEISNIVEFASRNFYQLNITNMISVSPNFLSKILSSPSLKANNEASLLEFVMETVHTQGVKAVPLLSQIKFQHLCAQTVNSFLKSISYKDISLELWDALCQRLVCGVEAYKEISENRRWVSEEKPEIIHTIELANWKLFAIKGINKQLESDIPQKRERLIEIKRQIDSYLNQNSDLHELYHSIIDANASMSKLIEKYEKAFPNEAAKIFLSFDSNPEAQWRYGDCLSNGCGVEKDLVKAARFYRLAADQNNAKGSNLYGHCLEFAIGVNIDYELAARYYKTSADQDDLEGQNHMGELLEVGKGVPQNFDEACRYYKLSAEQGFSLGENNYGFCLEKGRGVPQDPLLAAVFYKRAADQNDPFGLSNYGYCLQNGIGVDQNFEEAANYFKHSADLGNALGQNNYGTCFEAGKGVPQDCAKAVKYYKLSADQNNENGIRNYARCLYYGIGVDVNREEANRLGFAA